RTPNTTKQRWDPAENPSNPVPLRCSECHRRRTPCENLQRDCKNCRCYTPESTPKQRCFGRCNRSSPWGSYKGGVKASFLISVFRLSLPYHRGRSWGQP